MVRFEGDKELIKALRGLPKEINEPLAQKATSKAAIPLVNRMHRLAPVGLTGNLADSIGIVKSGKKNKGELGAIEVGPRRKGGKKGWAAHLVEFGTRRRDRKGPNRGVMPAEPFLEPAFEQTIDDVKEALDKELGKVVVAYLNKTVKK